MEQQTPPKSVPISTTCCTVAVLTAAFRYCSRMGELTAILPAITLSILLVGCASTGSEGHLEPGKKQSLKEWHRLTVESVRNPRVFVDHEQIRFYFYPQTNRPVEFRAKLTRLRLPSEEYQINSAPLLLLRKTSPMPIAEHHWREARFIST